MFRLGRTPYFPHAMHSGGDDVELLLDTGCCTHASRIQSYFLHEMPHCAAVGCSFQSKGHKGSGVSLHSFPTDSKRRKQWEDACGRTQLPKAPCLCSQHFSPDSFEAFSRPRLLKELTGAAGYKRRLKPNALPTIFSHKEPKRPRAASENRANKRHRQEMLDALLSRQPAPAVAAVLSGESPDTPLLTEETDRPDSPLHSSRQSAHFEADQFVKTRLREDAMPTIIVHQPVVRKRRVPTPRGPLSPAKMGSIFADHSYSIKDDTGSALFHSTQAAAMQHHTDSQSQRRMDSFVQTDPSCSAEKAAEFTDSILNMIVTDMRPVSMVEDEGFQKMISTFNPKYTLPPRTYFMKMIERKYEDFKGGQKELKTERENSPTPPSAPVTFSQDTSSTSSHPADYSDALPVVLVTVTDTGLVDYVKDYMEEREEPGRCGEKEKDGKRSELGPEPQGQLHVSTRESSCQVGDATSEAAPIQSSIKEESTEAMYGDPAAESPSALVQYENNDAASCCHDAAQAFLMRLETRAPQNTQTSEIPQSSHTVQAPSSWSSTSCDLETMDLDQLKREKIKMQIKVLKLQEEYYTQKIKHNKK